ncbi:PREDICTED: cytochrome c oxidase subunit 6B2-like [Dinoponera quadriceps]|uniref:Cytochrome c oxidase subunit n=1 Tax=Dinoponera quadriceps TaxID=609295 RepID=A0A6P3X0H9_DINQU|nr:PREDICTED: cytochrome c oxidase subunit 6B2-like [Dinoponera quadriceps]
MKFKPSEALEEQFDSVPFDPRFPTQNQTRYCYQSYLDFHRCKKKHSEEYDACQYFKKIYTSLCPIAWVDKWDEQVEAGCFAGRI